jgi:hypothetical protein
MTLNDIQKFSFLPVFSVQMVSSLPAADHTIENLEQGSQLVIEPISVGTMWGGQRKIGYRATATLIVMENNFHEAGSPEKLFEPLCGVVLDELILRLTRDKTVTNYAPAPSELTKCSFKRSDGNPMTFTMKVEPAEFRHRVAIEAQGFVQDITKLFSTNI